MLTLDEYERQRAEAIAKEAPKATGIECPECHAELVEDGLSLVSRVPPMKRVTCPSCKFSKVVLA